MSLSAWLEQEDPSDRYDDGLDSFERCVKATGIRLRSMPMVPDGLKVPT